MIERSCIGDRYILFCGRPMAPMGVPDRICEIR